MLMLESLIKLADHTKRYQVPPLAPRAYFENLYFIYTDIAALNILVYIKKYLCSRLLGKMTDCIFPDHNLMAYSYEEFK